MDRSTLTYRLTHPGALSCGRRGALPLPEARQGMGSERTAPGEEFRKRPRSAILARIGLRRWLARADGRPQIHTWNTTADKVERPDRLVWDIDPGPRCCGTKLSRRRHCPARLLQEAGPRIPQNHRRPGAARRRPAETQSRTRLACLDFARALSEAIEEPTPALHDSRWPRPAANKDPDRLPENNRTNTSVCAFSTRARRGATVSAPVRWEEMREPPRLDASDRAPAPGSPARGSMEGVLAKRADDPAARSVALMRASAK